MSHDVDAPEAPAALVAPARENGGPSRSPLPPAVAAEIRGRLAKLLVADMRENPPGSIGDSEFSVARGSARTTHHKDDHEA